MWRTSSGERTLKGAEAALIRAALGHILEVFRQDEELSAHDDDDDDDDDIDDPWKWGVRLFDNLVYPQKIALIANVASALLIEEVPCPLLNAVNEAAIGVIFVDIEQAADFEVSGHEDSSSEYRCYWRSLILRAMGDDEVPDDPLPSPDCTDMEEWREMIWALADCILWDDDWLDDGFVMDADPETAAFRKDRLCIDKDYYIAVAPDPTDEQLELALETLRRLAAE